MQNLSGAVRKVQGNTGLKRLVVLRLPQPCGAAVDPTPGRPDDGQVERPGHLPHAKPAAIDGAGRELVAAASV